MDPCQVSLNDGLELSEEEKAHWQDQAEADKARYDLAGALLQAQLTHSRPVSIKLPAGSHVLPATLLDETTQATELWLVGEGHSTSLQLANEADHFTLMPGAPALHLVNLQLNGVPLMMNGSILHLDGCNVQGMATEAGRRLTEAEGSRALTVVGGQVIVSNSTFEGHTAGALLVQGGHLKMIGSRLRNNKAKTGAAIRVDGTGRAEVNSTEIEANDASESGGGVQVDGSGQLYLGNDTLLFNNKAPAGNGAAIRVASGGVRYTLPAPKGRYVFIQGAGAMISYIGKISCIDTDNGTTDTDGYGCSPMYYDYPERCGGYDDTDFTSTDMCCACDGGFISVDEIADVDDDYPTACPPGVYGSSQEPTHQSGPTCEAPCPAGFECLKGTVVPVNCSMGDYCPCAPRHLNQHILANLDSPVHIRGRTGSPAGVPCAEGKYGARRGLREAGECSECPPGHYCSSGNKIACTKDTYTDEADAMRSDISACHQCPSHAVSPAESAGLYSCECAARYFDNRTDYEIASDRGAANSTGARCVLCPVPGTICTEPNMTLERLPLKTGYWRVSTTSLDLRSCPDRGHNESGCVGGDGDPCKEELFGPYCLLCRNSTRFYDEEASTCLECGEGRGLHPVHAMLIFVGALASLLLLYYLVRRRCARRLQRAQTRLRKLKMRLSLQTRFKILWNFIVVATNMRKIYKVTLPNDVRWALNSLGVFALELKLFGPLECLGLGQYFDQLRTMLIGPLAATFVALGLCLLRRMAFFCMNRVRKGSESEETTSPGTLSEAFKMAWLDALPWMLMITFISSPTSYNRAFRAFDCDKFEDGSRHLVAEYRVTCDSEEYILIRRLAWANISLYALVVPALYAVLLKLASKAIIEDDETALSSALAFLYRDFRRDAGTLYWELVEVAKKEILAGFMVLLSPGELFQLAVAMNVAILFLFLQAAVEPYRTQADNFLALSTNFALVMFFLCAVRALCPVPGITAADGWHTYAQPRLPPPQVFYKVASITDQLGDAVSPMVLATLRIDTVFLSSAMLIILAGSFCFGAFMLAHDLYMSARRARMERLAHIEAIKQRGQMAHPPRCNWPLGQGRDCRPGAFPTQTPIARPGELPGACLQMHASCRTIRSRRGLTLATYATWPI